MTWLVMGKQKLEDVWDISLGENRLNQVHMGHLTVCINFSVDTMQFLQWTELVSVCLLWLLLYKYIADVHSCYQAGLFKKNFFLARIIFINLEMTSFVINYHIVEKGLGSSWTNLVTRQSRFKLVNEVNCMWINLLEYIFRNGINKRLPFQSLGESVPQNNWVLFSETTFSINI